MHTFRRSDRMPSVKSSTERAVQSTKTDKGTRERNSFWVSCSCRHDCRKSVRSLVLALTRKWQVSRRPESWRSFYVLPSRHPHSVAAQGSRRCPQLGDLARHDEAQSGFPGPRPLGTFCERKYRGQGPVSSGSPEEKVRRNRAEPISSHRPHRGAPPAPAVFAQRGSLVLNFLLDSTTRGRSIACT